MRRSGLVRFALAKTTLGRLARRVPGLSGWYSRRALARRDHPGLFVGVYSGYPEALKAIPAQRSAGWDHEAVAGIWVDEIAPMQPSSYAVFLWIDRLLGPGQTLVDFGGSIGLGYFAYQRFRKLPDGSRWVVAEVPAIAEQGRRVAEREHAAALSFVTRLEDAPRADLLLSAGALQYMEESVPGLLERLGSKPRHLIFNKLPLTEAEGYWTLQNFGPAVSPYRVYNEREFLGYFEAHGYRLRDRWQVAELDCQIPFHPEHSLDRFTGLYLALDEEPGVSGP